MKFSDVVTLISEEAVKAGLPLLFGDRDCLNVQANDMAGMFLTFDVPSGTMNNVPPATKKYEVVLECLDMSYYMRDYLAELDTLERTDLALSRIMATFVCHFQVEGLRFSKLQNVYDSAKSGWQVTFTVSDDLLNYA